MVGSEKGVARVRLRRKVEKSELEGSSGENESEEGVMKMTKKRTLRRELEGSGRVRLA